MNKLIFFLAGGLFEGGLFDEAPMGDVPQVDHLTDSQQPAPPSPPESDDDMDNFGGPPSVGGARFLFKNNEFSID